LSAVKSRAIVVSKMEYSETSQILALLTARCGLVRAMAKGARRIKGNYEGGFDLFDTVSAVILVKTRGLSTITESRLVERPMSLRGKPAAFMAASAARELVLKGTAELDPDRALFGAMRGLLTALGKLPEAKAPLALVTFELAFLAAQGLAPELSTCAVCRAKLGRAGERNYDAREGGVVCDSCFRPRDMTIRITPGALALAEKLRREGFKALDSLAPNRTLVEDVQKAIKLTLAYSSFIVPRSFQYVWN